MPRILRAVYEQGVFKPTEEVNLPEGKKVQLIVWDAEPLHLAIFETQSGIKVKATCELEKGQWRWEWSLEEQVSIRENLERITIDPEQMGGVPCLRGLRIPVATVLAMLAEGMNEQEILAAYPDLEPEDIKEALRFAAEVLQKPPSPSVIAP
jgi:uncharacterized protein (DUF433 family)/predicted DNA-binding antitoxin AbrB/MazE fold protein